MAQYVTAIVLQKNNHVFVNDDGSIGAQFQVPTPDNGGYIDGDYWAEPVNEGIMAGFTYTPYQPANAEEATAPSVYAIAVCRISSSKDSDVFHVVGTAAQYVTASAGGAALPTIDTLPLIPGCQTLCLTDDDGNYFAVLGAPTLSGNLRYFPYGSLNGVALTAATATGYATATDLLNFLNAGTWANVGTWTKTADNLTFKATQASGSGTDVLCAAIITVDPSA